MGLILSRFRKEKTTYQILENLEEKIKNIEAYTLSTQQRQKRVVSQILVSSVGLTIIAFIVYYFQFFPYAWKDRIINATPLVAFVVIMTISKNIVAWVFQRKVNRNSNKLKDLRAEKKKLLEQVMEKETYKVAVEILKRFEDKPIVPIRIQSPTTPSPNRTHLQQRQLNTTQGPIFSKEMIRAPINNNTINRSQVISRTPEYNIRPGLIYRSHSSNQTSSNYQTPKSTSQSTSHTTERSNFYELQSVSQRNTVNQTPFPRIDFESRGIVEKMVDYLIGDGPSHRFAMICKTCYNHNGMAFEEEFYYTPFICAYCKAFNPSKKLRPIAPPLPTVSDSVSSSLLFNTINSNPNNTDTSSRSSDDSDEEIDKQVVTIFEKADEEKENVEVIDNDDVESNTSNNEITCEVKEINEEVKSEKTDSSSENKNENLDELNHADE